MKFIWAKGLRQEKNTNVAFTWKAAASGAQASLELCAVNLYRLYVNGQFVGSGPARTAHGHVRRDVYDLSAALKSGAFVIVAEVFGANINSYCHAEEPPFFGAALTVDGQILVKTEDFTPRPLTDRVQKVQRYSMMRTFVECYRMERCRTSFYQGDFAQFPAVEPEEVLTPKVLPRGVPFPTYAYVSGGDPLECGQANTDPLLPAWRDYSVWAPEEALRKYPEAEWEEHPADEANRLVCTRAPNAVRDGVFPAGTFALYTLGRNLTGFFKLRLYARRDSVLYLLWDEIITESPTDDPHPHALDWGRNVNCSVIKLTMGAGDYTFQSFEPYTGQYVRLVVTEGEIALSDLGMVLFESPLAAVPALCTDDTVLLGIVRAAKQTWEQNAVDILTDCPGRERGGYLCDTYFSGRAEELLTGRRTVERNYLENYAVAPQLPGLPEGMIPMCYPADLSNRTYIPNWSLWYIVELEEYGRAAGDRALVEQSRAKVEGVLAYFRPFLNEDGLLEDLEGWVFIEWSKANDPALLAGVNYPTNMLYSRALAAASRLYGDEHLAEQSARVRDAILRQSFNGVFFEDNRVREREGDRSAALVLQGHTSETCQYYAFFFDVADKEMHGALLEKLFTEFGPGRDAAAVYPDVFKSNAFVGNYLRLELLLRHGRYRQCLDECRGFFGRMAAMTGTLFEHNVEEYAKKAHSLNHGFASVAALYIKLASDGLCR